MNIHPLELKSFLDKKADFLLLDVREEWEYDEYNIGGLNIPLYNLPHRIDAIFSWKEKPIVVQCKSGNRGKTGAKYLAKNGFSNVRNLEGGILEFLRLFPDSMKN